MFYLETNCPGCKDGLLGFSRCNDNKTIVLVCDECASVWRTPVEVEDELPEYPRPPEFMLLNSNISLAGEKSGWATYEEIVNYGFGEFVSHEREYKP